MMPFRLGLTGSMGMGKSTTAALFVELGLPVWDADAAVHRLYAPGGAAVAAVAGLCPAACGPQGVDRAILRNWISTDPGALSALEAIIHPLVAEDRTRFLSMAKSDIVVLDIPLLFEKGTEADVDATLLCTAPAAVQKARLLARATMTESQIETILARQMPDAQKRARATHIVETLSIPQVRAYVVALVDHIRQKPSHA